MTVIRADSGVSQRLAEFVWAAHCGAGEVDFSLFSSLDTKNKGLVAMILSYRLYPERGGYELPLSAAEKDYLCNRVAQ